MKKILLVFGTRPEAIKMAPLYATLKKAATAFDVKICVTGQHRELLDQTLSLFNIDPEYDLNIMKQNQDLFDITSAVINGMKLILDDYRPDLLFVHGDTTTSMAAALSGYYKQIPVAHIEAGLRTYDIYSPWPEEINRQVIGRIATYHFAPTLLSKENLMNEGVKESSIIVTGNTVIDALYSVVERLKTDQSLSVSIAEKILNQGYDLQRLTNNKQRLVLITGHRRENFGEGFINICNALKRLADQHPEADFLYPMHFNPNVRNPIKMAFGEDQPNNLFFIEPLDYLSFIMVMEKSYLVLTDSGGIQEEAPGLSKPVLVMRDTTERPEALKAGTVKLVGTNTEVIVEQVSKLLTSSSYYSEMSKAINPYGDGTASAKIVQYLFSI